jgi:hypothetical protein
VGVHGDLVLGGISDETLSVGESDERGRCPVTLVIADDFAPAEELLATTRLEMLELELVEAVDLPIVTEDTHAGVGGTQVNTNSGSHFDWNVCNVEGKRNWVSK